jgi:hypothetical protein
MQMKWKSAEPQGYFIAAAIGGLTMRSKTCDKYDDED